VAAGGLLIYEAIEAGASTATLVRMGAYLARDSLVQHPRRRPSLGLGLSASADELVEPGATGTFT
jgi:hypothetical protein